MKKRVISLLLALVLAVSLLPTAAWAAEDTLKGSGTADDPYLIEDAEDLAKVTGSGHYALANDIDLTDTKYAGKSITPALSDAFSGTFDGNGHTISGLCINTKSKNGVGLFGTVNGASIQNLKVEGSVTGTNSGFVGGIVGKVQNCATIKNCSFTGTVANTKTSGSNVAAGGIVGRVNTIASGKSLSIEGCANHAAVSAPYAGGILGYATAKAITIKSCYNDASVTGSTEAGGIFARITASASVENCYNSGTVGNKTYGGIAGFSGATIRDCYWTRPEAGKSGGNGVLNEDKNYGKVDSISAEDLGNAFTTDTSGNVILKWEAGGSSEPQTPGLSISSSNGSALWTVGGRNHKTMTVLTVKTSHMGDTTPAVTWKYTQDSKVANIYGDGENPNALVVDADGAKGGRLSVTASVEYDGRTYTSKPLTITVIPNITSVAVKDAATGYDTTYAGSTVKAHIYTGGSELDPAFAGLVSYQWYSYDSYTTKYEKLDRATGETYQISEGFSANQILVEVKFGGETACAYQDSKAAHVTTGAAARLEADKAALTRAVLGAEGEDIKSALTLRLPMVGSVNGSTITWSCKPSGFIDTATGQVTLPESGKMSVTLTAAFSRKDTATTMSTPFAYTVWSQAAVDAETNDKTLQLNNALDAANISVLTPVFGTDTNVLTMVKNRLGREDITVTMGAPERTNATANLGEDVVNIAAENGTITYFYVDPNGEATANLQRFGTFSVPFTFERGGVTVERTFAVTVYWDRTRVLAAMKQDIVSDLPAVPSTATENFELPKVVNDKTWTDITWTSSDPAIYISTERQSSADKLLEPYVAVVRGSSVEKTVTLTAKLTFRYTNDVTGSEEPITLLRIYTVTVPASADGLKYQKALDAVFGEGSLTDAASGEPLTSANGVFTVRNDIQFPTTRDLNTYLMAQDGKGFDGKYTPLVITSSAPAVIAEPDVANAARVAVYRPAVGKEAKTVTLTVKILDRPSGEGRNYANLPVLAEKCFTVTVQPLTKQEITNELALMAQAKAHYWDGIRGANDCAEDVTADLTPFVEVYKQDGALVWVRDVREMRNSGIVPVAMNGWQELEAWRLFRSSNPAAVTHENLLVTQQFEGKAVTVTSALSSETLGRYGELYRNDPEAYADYKACDGLYYQPVSAKLVVRGRNTARMVKKMIPVNGGTETRLVSEAVEEKVTVSFTLSGNGELWLGTRTLRDLDEGVTVFDVLRQLRKGGVLSFEHKGGYVQSITCGGKTLTELDEGKNSGWLYTVNGELPDVYMSAYGLKNGDSVRVYFTKDYTKEPGADRWKPVTPVTKTETVTNADGSVTKIETKSDGTVIETTTWRDGSTLTAETSPNGRVETIEKRADGTTVETVESASGEITASVSVPKSVGSTRVDIPVSKPTGSMVAVIVHPDGTEEIVRGSVVTETGVALRAEGDVRLKIIDNAKSFNDMADHWAKDAVEFASSRELFNGVGNDAFGPDRSMTRGMVGTVLARLAGADTAGGETWYAKGTVWAVENGISDGTAPEQPVTREQLAAMLYRYAGSPAVSGELGFDDADSISAWARDAVRWCVDNGILNGVGGNRMAPQDLAQRGQVAAMLMRFLQATV